MKPLIQIPASVKAGTLALAISIGLFGCSDNDSDNGTAAAKYFNRVASFPVCSQLESACNTDTTTAAEIVAASSDGMTLIYTNSPDQSVGFVDITDPASPVAAGRLEMGGEPTSVAVKDNYALVAVNTSADYINVGGKLVVIDVSSKGILGSIDLGGQPDSISISPDGQYAAIAIENERNEDLNDGALPQLPAGYLTIVKLDGEPQEWTTRKVKLTGIASLYPTDPEPEYVDINEDNIAVVTLQENNHIALVDLKSGTVNKHFSAGSVNLAAIDTEEEGPALISLTGSQNGVLREPDGVTWLSTSQFVTADEGDLDGGSRTFTVFNTSGQVVYGSGNELDHETVRIGHYPDSRSKNKGNEPENADHGSFGGSDYLFVASERSSLIFVYDIANPASPSLHQVLPAASGPEGVLAIPSRNLLVAASEVDSRADILRSAVNIYQYGDSSADYPTLQSADDANGNPIAWGALSGLAADPNDASTVYAIEDSYYRSNRIFKIDVSMQPALLESAITLKDSNNAFANLRVVAVDGTLDDNDPARHSVFDSADLAAMINADKTVNIDPEGVAVASGGGFWVASEGAGTLSEGAARPLNSPNLIFRTDANGVIKRVITLPDALNAKQVRFGFEGITEYNSRLYVAFQRAWAGDAQPMIGIFDLQTGTWSTVYYPLDAVASQNGGWVGLSDISSYGDGTFLVVERDNQGGPDAAVKRLYRIDLSAVTPGMTVSKTLVRNLMPDLKAKGGLVPEKIEGSAILPNGEVLIVNDNDGIEDNSGETQLINLGKL